MKLLYTSLVLLNAVNAQFTCTFSATDEPSCLSHKDDDGSYCVWCALSQFSFCVDEKQAESMENSVPGVECERNDKPSSDDDQAPDDDGVAPSDDSVPDNYWKCLLQKTADDCHQADCTWCKTKAGFGVCMTGPSAEAAGESDWFDCAATTEIEQHSILADPYDPTCALSFLQNPTEDGCKAATDSDGNACEFCDLQGMANLCLSEEQAEMAKQIGVTCSSKEALENPFDPACGLAFLQNPTKQGCKASSDSEGKTCQFCDLDGNALCLSSEQAKIVGQVGVTCEDDAVEDIYDPMCALSFLQNPSEDGCKAATDSDGNACQFCDLQGMGNLCLSAEQAEMAQQIGVTCDASSISSSLRGAIA